MQTGERAPMRKHHADGLFVAELDATWADAPYHFEAETARRDRVSLMPILTCLSAAAFRIRHLSFRPGTAPGHLPETGRAPTRTIAGVAGINFAVWAPNCYKVAVVGDFNRWDARVHIMENNNESGIWEIFVPGLEAGAHYKFEIRSHNEGYRAQKADPYGFFSELRPQTASIVYDIDGYEWHDRDWLDASARRETRSPSR